MPQDGSIIAEHLFHPVIARWFASRFAGPTDPQRDGWPEIAAGRHTLIAAPTGSGKTLTAFLAIIDRLFRRSLEAELPDEMCAVYVSPLRALSNDMHRNLETPLAEILELARSEGLDPAPIRIGLRTGDTPSHRRAQLNRRPPHLLVTTPESLYLMLTAERSREALSTVDTVIVDEIHALVRDKRGSHLALTMERLEALTGAPLQRIGLSATQKPIETMAEFLVGSGHELQANTCRIVDVGHVRDLDLSIEAPTSELSAVCSHEQWAEVNARLVELIQAHRSTLIFVNTRRLAERVTHQLTDLLGEDAVASHHGSLAADARHKTESDLKSGRLRAVVATASLELGIDVGHIDLVVQLGSPRSIATFLQRVGRSGHALGLTPRGRLFALTRDELLECMALVRAIRAQRLDAVSIPEAPLDVLAQQIVAEVSAREWPTDTLFALCRRAYPYRNLDRGDFDETVRYLSEGVTDTSGRTRTHLHHDRVNGMVRPRRGARLAAINNGGAIPEVDSVRVLLEAEQTAVGSVDEDFAIESMAGDIFLLGNSSWRIRQLRGNDLIVDDAHGAPPTIPFWRGEAPGRTAELSAEVSSLRCDIAEHVQAAGGAFVASDDGSPDEEIVKPELVGWLSSETAANAALAQQAIHYVATQLVAIGVVPTQERVVFERFFDESGGMQLVVHAPFGGRINRAWGLAMRKRFCRSFDFELQASADDDGFVLSLGPQHSFPIESLFPMLTADNVRRLLEQALLAVPMFHLRWRWNVTRALLVARARNGKKVPPAIQRFRSEDLLTAVFPKLTGCQEKITGDHEIPDHPLMRQTVEDCLHEALDLDGLRDVLQRVDRGEVVFVAHDTREPSPFAYELLNANPYAFLDGGEIQERRARAVATRRTLTVESVRDLGKLDPAAITQVVAEAQPPVRSADELHDVLLSRIVLPPQDVCASGEAESGDVHVYFAKLMAENRAGAVVCGQRTLWIAAERWRAAAAIHPTIEPPPTWVQLDESEDVAPERARTDAVRGLLEVCGPITAAEVADRIGIQQSQAEASLEALEGEGAVLQGRFRPADESDVAHPPAAREWCHRRLLARIHRLTIAGLRREIEPVDPETFIQFVLNHHGVTGNGLGTGANGVFAAISQLQGWDVPAVCWERDLLPARIADYRPEWLDELCLDGEIGWARLFPVPRDPAKSKQMSTISRVVPVSLYCRSDLWWLAPDDPPDVSVSDSATELLELLRSRGAMFAADLLGALRLLPSQLDELLGELVARGAVTADGFSGLRALIRSGASNRSSRRRPPKIMPRRRASGRTGRWSAHSIAAHREEDAQGRVEQWAWQLLRRWGVVFRELVRREPGAPPWYQLLQVFRRLEARGEIRGGRFVRGVGGEQFALPDAVRELRALRERSTPERVVILSAADPLNLVGIVTSDRRVPATSRNRVVYVDGRPIAAWQAGQIRWIRPAGEELKGVITSRLLPRRSSGPPASEATDETGGEGPPAHTRRPRHPTRIPRPMIS